MYCFDYISIGSSFHMLEQTCWCDALRYTCGALLRHFLQLQTRFLCRILCTGRFITYFGKHAFEVLDARGSEVSNGALHIMER